MTVSSCLCSAHYTSSLRLHLIDSNTSLLHISTSNLSNIDHVVAIEVLGNFLHGSVAGFDEEEVDDVDLETKEHAVDDVVLPAHGLEGNTVDVLVEEERGSNTEVEPEVENNACADSRSQVHGATSKLVNEEGKSSVDNQTLCLHACIDAKLSFRLGNTDVVHDLLEVVRDKTVATPLTEETEGSDETDPLAVALCPEEVSPAGLSDLLVESNGCLDFAELELDEFILGVVLGVVVSQDLQGFVMSVLAQEPTGTLWHPVESDDDDDTADGLKKTGKSPGPVALD
ncbi:hypothetical protein HG530_010770 [Fusarium avenaceum]|nr:hypothetical protein HG530_010770 [Fusarium avenaceum]